jgi:hypothetical protein
LRACRFSAAARDSVSASTALGFGEPAEAWRTEAPAAGLAAEVVPFVPDPGRALLDLERVDCLEGVCFLFFLAIAPRRREDLRGL